MTYAFGFAALGFAATALVLGIRFGGLKAARAAAEAEAERLAESLDRADKRIHEITTARNVEVANLRIKIATLRGRIDSMPDSAAARALVLDDLDSMLQGETDPG